MLKQLLRNKKNKSNLALIVTLIFVILGLSGYIVYSKYFNPKTVNIVYVRQEVGELIIKLGDTNKKTYVKVNIVLSYDKSYKDFEKNMPIIKDTCISFFTSISSSELTGNTLDSTKAKLIQEINSILGENIVDKVYFTDLVVQ